MTDEQKSDLRHQMYAWCVTNGLAKDKSEAKDLLKQNCFLVQPQKTNVVKQPVSHKSIRKDIMTWSIEEQLALINLIALNIKGHFQTLKSENNVDIQNTEDLSK